MNPAATKSALRRVLDSWGLLTSVVVVGWVVSAALGGFIREVVGAHLGSQVRMPEISLLSGVAELLAGHSGIAVDLGSVMAASWLLAGGLWLVLAGGVISRLSRPLPAPRIAAECIRFLPKIAVTSLWHFVARAVLVVALVKGLEALGHELPWSAPVLLPLLVALAFCRCALDLSRGRLVLAGASGFHPRTALIGFAHATRRPGVLVASVLLSLAQWATSAAALLCVVRGLEDGTGIWPARALGALGVFFGLWRLGVAVREVERSFAHEEDTQGVSVPVSPAPATLHEDIPFGEDISR